MAPMRGGVISASKRASARPITDQRSISYCESKRFRDFALLKPLQKRRGSDADGFSKTRTQRFCCDAGKASRDARHASPPNLRYT